MPCRVDQSVKSCPTFLFNTIRLVRLVPSITKRNNPGSVDGLRWNQVVLVRKLRIKYEMLAHTSCFRSGFHRCFSGTVALNLMIESEGM